MRSRVALSIAASLALAACAVRPDASVRPVAAPGVIPPAAEPAAAAEPSADVPPLRPGSDEGGPSQEPPPREPNPYVVPPVRRGGDLTVEVPPRTVEGRIGGRLRSHVEGSLSKGSPRTWVGPQVPWFVPLVEGTAELFLLDRVGDEFMAFYRDPYDASSCRLGDDGNCHYFVTLYDLEGQARWSVALHELLSAPRYLEVQDVRWADGTLYFNEACQSYASGAQGKCSALVAYDPVAKAIRWRTRPLISNGVFLIHGDYVVCGYGFTGERDFVHVVRRRDGKLVQRLAVPKAPEHFAIGPDGKLEVTLYPGTLRTYALQGFHGPAPRLVRADRPAPPREVITGPP
jgi:hypothetical protein